MTKTGVFPVFENKFRVGTRGMESAEADMALIKEITSFEVSMDGAVDEWTPLDTEGWTKRLMAGKAFTLSMSGKRYAGDPGNDYLFACAWKTGRDCNTKFEWEFPSGAKLKFDCVVSVTAPGGGDSTTVDSLEVDIMSSGKPQFVAADAAVSE